MSEIKAATDHAIVMIEQAVGLINTAVLSSPDKNIATANVERINGSVENIKSEVRNIQILLS